MKISENDKFMRESSNIHKGQIGVGIIVDYSRDYTVVNGV